MTQTDAPPPTQAVFERIVARQAAAPDAHHARLVHVQWNAPDQGGRLVQLYVDGELAGTSASPTARDAWLLLDPQDPHEIELLAVDPADAATPSSDCLAGTDPPTHPAASATLMRDPALPTDTVVSAWVDEEPAVTTPMFSADAPRGGFGAVFGEGGFGIDASTGPGLGLGELGFGPLGTDGTTLRWRDASLTPGPHTLRLEAIDAAGNPVADELAFAFSTSRLPEPPTGMTLSPDLQLTWT